MLFKQATCWAPIVFTHQLDIDLTSCLLLEIEDSHTTGSRVVTVLIGATEVIPCPSYCVPYQNTCLYIPSLPQTFELATGDYLFEPHSGHGYSRDEGLSNNNSASFL